MTPDQEKILLNLVREGTVTAVDNNKRLARVKFQDTGITSAWLKVLSNQPYIPGYNQPPSLRAAGQGTPPLKATSTTS